MMDRATFLTSLPRKRVAAGAVIRDEAGAIYIVEPTYKPLWHFPGGTIEAHESPSSGCERELVEELGLNVALGRLALNRLANRRRRPAWCAPVHLRRRGPYV